MKTIVIGGGPAGLFAAFLLVERGNKVIVLDKGKRAEDRSEGERPDLLHGIGGAGLFSDGKLNYSPDIGTNLVEIIGREKTMSLIDEVEKRFTKMGVSAKEPDQQKVEEWMIKAAREGIRYIPARQAHIGSDKLPKVIRKLQRKLENMGTELRTQEEVVDINEGKVITKKGEIRYDKLLIAPGRSGAKWLEEIVRRLKINFIYNPIDIGVRVEVPAMVMEEVTRVNWDPKVYIRTPTYDDVIRTFCVSPHGYIVREGYKNFSLVNGHSRGDKRSDNTNFAFLIKVALTQPLENTNQYGEAIAFEATTIGGGRPIIQRLEDLLIGRRSTWERIGKSFVKPTLKDVTPGDIAMALPYRFVKDITEGLEKLNHLIRGVYSVQTLVYAPEIKFHGLRIMTDKFLQTNIKDIFVAGDGAGLSRGIVGAAASGILAAKGILGEKWE